MSRSRTSILVVDDDRGIVDWLVEDLGERGYDVVGETDPRLALERVAERAYDVVVSDVEMPGMRGLDLVKAIHGRRSTQMVILITAFGTIDLAMQCVRAGAADFLAKPFPIEALVHSIDRTLRERKMRKEIVRLRTTLAQSAPTDLVAVSASMRRALDLAQRAAASSSTVLLTGESGVGKSAFAQFIHGQSPRREHAFVQLNCAALPANLVEAELFGVKRGAFTDAREDREGLFSAAHGGTLFLDEIAEMALDAQPKLLTALETGTFRAVGGRQEKKVDVRLIAATNRPLEDALRDRNLRPDLYHRLNVIRLDIPPLRERPEDIPALVDQCLQRLSARVERSVIGVSDEASRWLCAQPWPGNVRELANVIERAMMLSDHDVLVIDDFVDARDATSRDDVWLERAVTEGVSLDDLERRYIRRVLERCDDNKAKAARVLGVDRTTLWRKLQGQQ